jgi:hypothetical protein
MPDVGTAWSMKTAFDPALYKVPSFSLHKSGLVVFHNRLQFCVPIFEMRDNSEKGNSIVFRRKFGRPR